MKIAIWLAMMLFIIPAWSADNEANNQKAKEIMTDVVDRYQGETKVSNMSLITCAYEMQNGRIRCQSGKRKKTLQSFVKSYGQNLKDTKGFTYILSPVSEKGISILQYDYESQNKDADQWLYLPELQKVKRIASDGSAPKKGSLFGSEFSLEDIERLKINEYTYKLLSEEKIKGTSVAVIEVKPTKERASRTSYSKQIVWVDTDKSIVVKVEYYAWDGSMIKVRQAGGVKKIDDIWTVGKEVMRNVETKRISELSYTNVSYNVDIKDEMLTLRILTDPGFRTSILESTISD